MGKPGSSRDQRRHPCRVGGPEDSSIGGGSPCREEMNSGSRTAGEPGAPLLGLPRDGVSSGLAGHLVLEGRQQISRGSSSSLQERGLCPWTLEKLRATMTATSFLLVLIGCLFQESSTFKIASFNIQRFSESKVTDVGVRNLIIQILRRYELISVQEVMSSDDTAIISLVRELNNATGSHYNLLISDHLGRSSYREKYVYIYREDIVKPTRWYHYDDGCENCGTDSFIREPFVAQFQSLTTELKSFVLISIHTSPDYAVSEVDALFDAWEDAQQQYLIEDILILGDFNADCSYITSKDWPRIRLRQAENHQWLIGDNVDTTVSTNTHCAYDRIVASGAGMLTAVLPHTATAFNFQDAFGLSYEMTKAISDHYPVELELCLDPEYSGERFRTSPSLGVDGGRTTSVDCDCTGVNLTSCRGRCGAYSSDFPCHCNASCRKYSSCCLDYTSYC
ncbi:deoxyribonuclease-1-like [Rhinatrema bivittatum]|uniref:deoxyribonuclease-1-like n=1 Tax=Rhinatrema bivittatum TaxID=194408 RepID=UPI00112D307C|nr:deoxyribonuclease-1-like [Rhinatrema bivittatum]